MLLRREYRLSLLSNSTRNLMLKLFLVGFIWGETKSSREWMQHKSLHVYTIDKTLMLRLNQTIQIGIAVTHQINPGYLAIGF
jgi:hypothetical protein